MKRGRDEGPHEGQGIFEPDAREAFDPRGIVTACIESGADAVLLDEAALTPEFFDLSTRAAGELFHQLGKYRIRLAGVVPDPSAHSRAFQDFLAETNRGNRFRFFASRAEAMAWLEAAER